MAIAKDKQNNKYYITYKYKTPAGEWKTANIKNKSWIIEGPGKVGIKFIFYHRKSEEKHHVRSTEVYPRGLCKA